MPETALTIEIPRAFDGGTIHDAFHGTNASDAASIMREGFRPGLETHMFGCGVYFFEGDYKAALWWAKRDAAGGQQIAVVRSAVELGCTLYVNLLKKALGRLRDKLSERLGTDVELGDAYKVLVAKLVRANMVDSLKAVRAVRANRARGMPPSLRAEVIVVVLNPERASPLEQLSEHDLGPVARFRL